MDAGLLCFIIIGLRLGFSLLGFVGDTANITIILAITISINPITTNNTPTLPLITPLLLTLLLPLLLLLPNLNLYRLIGDIAGILVACGLCCGLGL